ncbi:MAG: metallophosphoesterase [Proteobacteria bacterium]|nr:metallophosphoesterase [Cystobacterineae bacterium]MCL2259497.1 metallophosphoesterase [Cystobacterineae bacterium]MCL2314037.1 metallophosphoesterase [Pseudomonadota bacterium]
MHLFAIADLHLPSTRQKTMECFGWLHHPDTLAQRWDETVSPEDCVIVAGDISWALKPAEAVQDFAWLHQRPGKKILLKGNHDYWWPHSARKLNALFEAFPSIVGCLHNGAVCCGPYVVSGSRLWEFVESPWTMSAAENGHGTPNLAQMLQRETQRLQASLEDAQTYLKADSQRIHVVATHFPPLYADGAPSPFSSLIESYGPKHCVYGHLHGPSLASGFVGVHEGVNYVLASADAANFCPLLVDAPPAN